MIIGLNHGAWNDIGPHAIGYNQFLDEATTASDNPPTPYLSKNQDEIEKYFDKIDGLSVVRIWINYEHEGIKFEHGTTDIVGIDEEHWLPNIKKILDIAQQHNCKIYYCLVEVANTGTFNDGDNEHYRKTQKKKDDKVLTPLIKAIGDHPALYGIDLMNEPEMCFDDHTGPLMNEEEMVNFIKAMYDAIKQINKNVQVSCGCLKIKTAQKISEHLDFADYHIYVNKKMINDDDDKPMHDYRTNDFNDKPCIIGECGMEHDKVNKQVLRDNEVKVVENLVKEAKDKGYKAVLPWGITHDHDFMGDDNRKVVLQWLKSQ